MKINQIYDKLKKEYGKMGWWPTISSNKRFEISIGAILTQNTSWRNVEKAIFNLEKFNFLNKEAIKQIDEKELGEIIKSSGYYKQKSKKLKKFVEFLDSGKEINRENLLEIWGVGKETADSILLYAYNKDVFVVDAYTKRIMERLGFKFNDYDELQKIFIENLPKDYKLYNEFHALLVRLGKEYCKKKPKCDKCCLRKECKFNLI